MQKSVDNKLASFNPIGPLINADIFLQKKYNVDPTNILQKAELYLKSLKAIADINTEDFRAFFWSVPDKNKNEFCDWFFKNGPTPEKLIESQGQNIIDNQGIATILFYIYGIKGLIFSLPLIKQELDVAKIDVRQGLQKELFLDLVNIFRFIRNSKTGKLFLTEKQPGPGDLKRAIKKWQETEARFELFKMDDRANLIGDGLLREEDKVVLYTTLVGFLVLALDVTSEMYNSLN